MEQADLKAAQAPLEKRYRAEPEAARVTFRAEGRLGEAEVSCRVDTGRALVEAKTARPPAPPRFEAVRSRQPCRRGFVRDASAADRGRELA
jgi:hypothetical protein